MPSAALLEWQDARATRLDELHDIHATIGGTSRGRRWRTQQINWAITLRLAGEFQGFARDLHTLSADCFADWACGGNPAARGVATAVLTQNRQLDRGNAQPSSLGSDFGRLGLNFWTSLAAQDRRTPSRQTHLERLNDARNAITHSRPAELQTLEAAGYPITMPTIRTWRRALSALATTMDAVMADHLAHLFGRVRPW
jgi:hypothetical protein